MELAQISKWLLKSKRRQRLLQQLFQPMTANQLHTKMRLNRRDCSDVISDMCKTGILVCLNPEARRSRLYGLTKLGKHWRTKLYLDIESYDQPTDVDWNLYGYVCFNHRKSILLALDEPRKPSDIKRHLRYIAPEICISANNIRNIIPELEAQNILTKADSRGVYPKYELTEIGRQLQLLLRKAVSILHNDTNQ